MPADIVLVRHARSVVPTPGGPDEYHRPLTDVGMAAADRLVELLAEPVPTAIDSPKTAAPTAPGGRPQFKPTLVNTPAGIFTIGWGQPRPVVDTSFDNAARTSIPW